MTRARIHWTTTAGEGTGAAVVEARWLGRVHEREVVAEESQ
jgi:hypothetical protein